jgi:ubiquinone/menaquinone biosynthesis C-methylase UbiE
MSSDRRAPFRIRTPWIFGLGAGIYDAITAQDTWRGHCRKMAAQVPGRRVLDLGIGPGVSGIEMLRADPRKVVVGVDCSASMIARAKRHVAAAGVALMLVRGDASQLPFADATYEGAIGHSFLYLLADSDAVLKEVHRVVQPGGRVAFLEPNCVDPRERCRAVRDAYRHGFRFGTSMLLWSIFSALHGRYTATSLAAQLTQCGFVDTRVIAAFEGLGLMATAQRP